MFSLFSGKISGVLSMAFQGITKTVGSILKTVVETVDSLSDTLQSLTNPLTDSLTQLPIVGESIGELLDLKSNILGNVSEGLHSVADQLIANDLGAVVTSTLEVLPTLIGDTLSDAVEVADSVLDLTTPVTGLLNDVPVLGDLLNSVGETSANLLGFVEETGNYVSDLDLSELVGGLLSDPTASIGGVIQDASGTLDSLLNDLVPVTDLLTEIPVVGDVAAQAGQLVTNINQGIFDLGTQVSQIDLLGPLNTNQAYV